MYRGTAPQYASVMSLKGFTLSRRDDMESLGYIIMDLMHPDFKATPKDIDENIEYKYHFLGIEDK